MQRALLLFISLCRINESPPCFKLRHLNKRASINHEPPLARVTLHTHMYQDINCTINTPTWPFHNLISRWDIYCVSQALIIYISAGLGLQWHNLWGTGLSYPKEMKSCMLLMNIPPSFLLYDVAQHHLCPKTENQMVIGLIHHFIDIYSQQNRSLKGHFKVQ